MFGKRTLFFSYKQAFFCTIFCCIFELRNLLKVIVAVLTFA